MKNYLLLSITFLLFSLTSCTGIPSGLKPINNFQAKKYVGEWYEIARFDHSFERGLTNVSAEYTMIKGNVIRVLNKGYNPETKSWKTAEGKAYLNSTPNIGSLEVVFFWPFYGSYNIIDVDNNYSYAMICGYNKNYFWILSRKKELDKRTLDSLLIKAKKMGFSIDKLIFVEQNLTADSW